MRYSLHEHKCTIQTFWTEDQAPHLSATVGYQTALWATETGKPLQWNTINIKNYWHQLLYLKGNSLTTETPIAPVFL